MTMKIAFIGFGGVGQALAELLHTRRQHLLETYGLDTQVVAVSDVMKGAVYHPEGLDIPTLLREVRENGSVTEYPDHTGLIKGWDSIQTIEQSNADMIVEVTFTDVETGQPAIDHCKCAFTNKKSVVTTNKGPVALAYRELAQLAEENQVYWGFEGTVMSGTPALRMPLASLAGNEITEIRGILNGTTNYMLTEMEKGSAYQDALEKAQSLGYAEADPTSDVEGYDVRYKTAILANYVMGYPLASRDIPCKGISGLTQDDIKEAKASNKRWKLLARVKKEGDQVTASVQPELIDQDDSLAGITGPTNAIVYDCDMAGEIMLTGAGAGLIETGYSLLIDIIDFHRTKTPIVAHEEDA
ncbi:homoserine dehydrogenase [Radiobacillus kanasensis]|uniref:homoserine dehydrogenase n=1 Tax=Radiobacillus kanasensis TaxID=2844358 RepID=UPI001E436914|nr:homoserine dehydrogenase [Radiobacillus kanasensis]UFT99181.1 homoserine dehydrogenase [Radiobacillus kanasensis]